MTVLNAAEEDATVELGVDSPRPRSVKVVSGAADVRDGQSLTVGIKAREGTVLSVQRR